MEISHSFGGSYAGPEFGDSGMLEPDGAPSRLPSVPKPPIGPVAGVTRRHLTFGIGAIVVAWVVLVFARAVSDSAAATDRVGELRGENARLGAQLEAGERELEQIRAPRFVEQQARAFGMGGPGERAFALPVNAGPPPEIRPLGSSFGADERRAPLDAWLDLLFGAR